MNQSLVAIRYAKALFNLAKEKSVLEKVYNDLVFFRELLSSSSELKGFINSPLYKPSKKKEMVKLLNQSKIESITLQFLYLVIDKKRESILPEIIQNYQDLYRKEKNIKRVLFKSPSKLDPSFYDALKRQIENSLNAQIELTTEQNPELLGGFVLMVDGKLMDASISNQLKQIQKRLLS